MLGLSLIIGGFAAYMIYKDARRCGHDIQSAIFWAIGAIGASVSPLVLTGVVAVYFFFGRRPALPQGKDQIIDIEAEVIDDRVSCPGCGQKIKKTYKVCPYCSKPLQVDCQHCGRDLEPEWQICPYCKAPREPN